MEYIPLSKEQQMRRQESENVNKKQDFLWYWLHSAPGLSRQSKQKMLDYYGEPEKIFTATKEQLEPFFRRKDYLEQFLSSRCEERIRKTYEEMNRKGIHFTHIEAMDFPSCLKVIPDPPIGLFYRGEMPSEEKKTIAIIGSRDCTRYGSEMARFFGRELARVGFQVVSGLARGIDGMAHEGALEVGGYTIGVLGCGVDVVYPVENYELFMQMEKTGGILSESMPGQQPYSGLFPQRNRLISGLADGILVVEAMEKSGTFITVDQGLEQGKEIFALPGRIVDEKSRGCNNLIKLGAHMVTEVQDILEVLHFESKDMRSLFEITQGKAFLHKNLLAPNEKIVYSCLRVEPQYLDRIIQKAQIAPQEVCMALNHLTVLGGVVETTRNYYALRI
ncbi:MAG: DNA-processing protein DprA [Lachnospiraceae bacterium]|nr:DNA-processing protein DprA [Lachnospiraceae bacterium]